jgi:hypothetical protein
MLVKTLRGFVLGIDEHGEHAQFGPRDTEHRISQKYAAESFAFIIPGYR